MQKVLVQYDARTETLSAEPPDLDLGTEADAVIWIYRGLLPGLWPALTFVDPGSNNLGPFAALRTTPTQIVAEGRSARTGTFKYMATVLNDSLVPIAMTAPLSLTAAPPKANPTPTVLVRPGPNGSLEIDPETIAVWNGDTVIWRFSGFAAEGWYPEVLFEQILPSGNLGLGLGPFQSFTRHSTEILGAALAGPKQVYRYKLRILASRDGKVLFTRDPTLANNGDPPGGAQTKKARPAKGATKG